MSNTHQVLKDSEILRIAKERLATGLNTMVCLAIEDGVSQVRDDLCDNWEERITLNTQVNDLRRWITNMLGSSSYECWMRRNYEEFYKTEMGKYYHQCHFDNTIISPATTARMKWVDWMIKYCEERGL